MSLLFSTFDVPLASCVPSEDLYVVFWLTCLLLLTAAVSFFAATFASESVTLLSDSLSVDLDLLAESFDVDSFSDKVTDFDSDSDSSVLAFAESLCVLLIVLLSSVATLPLPEVDSVVFAKAEDDSESGIVAVLFVAKKEVPSATFVSPVLELMVSALATTVLPPSNPVNIPIPAYIQFFPSLYIL
nr:hypothetical protein [Pediococcus stilesii]